MADSVMFGGTWKLLGESLKVSARRQNLISGNIANVDTIGYKPRDLDFQKTLQKVMAKQGDDDLARTHPGHFGGETPLNLLMAGETRDDSDPYHPDSVDIDKETTKLMENNIKYRTAAEIMLRKVAKLKYAISEGGQ